VAKPSTSEDETRAVSKAEIEAGVTAKAGHRVVFVVDGLKGTVLPGKVDDAPPDDPAQPTTPARPDQPEPQPATPGEIELHVFSVSGAPQASLELELKLPDGSKRAGRTGADGHFALDELPPSGQCALDIPDVKAPATDTPASAGRVRYKSGLPIAIGSKPVVELPPRVHRGRLSGIHFETNKTFLLPSAMAGIRQLASIYKSFGTPSVLVTGHTDTVGDAEYNRGLSVERAESIAAFLVDDVERWRENYQAHPHSAAWGVREDQLMLSTLPQGGAPFYTGRIDGQAGPLTKGAYQSFQSSKGLPQSGRGDDATRRALIADYMAIPGTSLPKGSPKPLTHGCGLTHLAEPTGPGVDNLANRRVEIFLFEGAVIPPPQTPCPSGGCPEFAQWQKQAGDPIDLDKPPGSIAVSVVDGAGKPLDGANVHASGITPADGTSSGGKVSFDALVPGTYKLIADLTGFEAADAQVDVASGAQATVTLQLKELPPMEIASFSVRTVAAGG